MFCDFSFARKDKLKQHVDKKHDDKTHKLKINSHKKQERLVKNQTSKQPYLEINQNNHEQLHKRFKCSICNYETSTSFKITRHVDEVHLKKKLFFCKICDTYFTRKEHLKRHTENGHEKFNQVRCTNCEYTWCYSK